MSRVEVEGLTPERRDELHAVMTRNFLTQMSQEPKYFNVHGFKVPAGPEIDEEVSKYSRYLFDEIGIWEERGREARLSFFEFVLVEPGFCEWTGTDDIGVTDLGKRYLEESNILRIPRNHIIGKNMRLESE